ncbi:hypothetical protein QTI66_29415 [Variovorax sp. J22R133]|uniref:hypothetical protein n=1 Tax=Variovorax brevis TaxID=3053503 RepID=UPI002578FC51|nr:hypothetical protein [Variovorax sp. J22R133]MDM0116284.1 hypothetical protein [Variovorax sp. J22R133]
MSKDLYMALAAVQPTIVKLGGALITRPLVLPETSNFDMSASLKESEPAGGVPVRSLADV